jgi:hypothetical protein
VIAQLGVAVINIKCLSVLFQAVVFAKERSILRGCDSIISINRAIIRWGKRPHCLGRQISVVRYLIKCCADGK